MRNTRNFLCTSDAGQVRRLGLDLLRAPEPHALCKEAAKSPLPPKAAVHAMTRKGEGEAAGALACKLRSIQIRQVLLDLASCMKLKKRSIGHCHCATLRTEIRPGRSVEKTGELTVVPSAAL